METTIKTRKNSGVFPLLFSGALVALALVCFVLHLSPKQVALALSEFARHHYFLTGFIFLVLALISMKYYGREIENNESNGGVAVHKMPGRSKRRLKVMVQNFKRSVDPYRDESESLYVSKEALYNLKFQKKEVLEDQEQRQKRKADLQAALSLGNLYKQKVIICFKEDASSLQKHTLATVWHVDDENVCLKGGNVIPVKNIYKVEL